MKRLISLASAMILVLTTVFSSTALAAFTDVDSSNRYFEAITILSKLKIIDGYADDNLNPTGEFGPNDPITRGQFAKIVTYTLGLSELKTEPTEFSDISEHWARYNIKTAYDKKIVNGFTDGTFRPDDNVTYEQALKMVVCTLGYGDMAENQGGYPTGYHNQSAVLGLTDNIEGVSFSEAAPRGVIAQIVYNALEISMKELAADGVNWVSTEKTLLNDYLYVKKFEGEMAGVEDYVTGNCNGKLLLGQMQVVDLSNPSNYVTMNYTEYTENITDISKLLGKKITAYYRQKNPSDEPVLVIFDDESANNEECTINYKDIVSANNGTIKYYKEGVSSVQTLKFDPDNVSVRYNGKSVDKTAGTKLRNKNFTSSDNEFTSVYSFTDAIEAWLNPTSEFFIYGDIVFTDRGGDGKFDDIQINDYQTIVAIKSPSVSDYKISDKLRTGNSLILNPEDTKYSFTIVEDGKQIKTTAISANDVLLVAESIDEKLYTVYVTNNKISGKITSINASENTLDIDNVTYTIGSQCESYISSKQDGKQFSTGQEVTLYTDMFDTLVYGEIASETALPYAFISTAYEEAGTETCYITAYCPTRNSSQATNYPLKTKLSVNGETMTAKAALAKLKETSSNSNKDVTSGSVSAYSQLIKMEVNTDGEISKIITLADETNSTNEDADKIVRCKELGTYTYSSSSFLKSGQTQFSMNSSTLIIVVPSDRARDGFSKKSTSSLTTGKDYTLEAYDISSSRYAKVVLVYGESNITEVSKTTLYSIVSKTPTAVADDDDVTQQFNVYSTALTEKTWKTADTSEFSDVAIGDVLLFGYDQNGKATGRIDCILYSDIKNMLDGKKTSITVNGETKELSYHWALGEESTSGWVSDWSNTKYDYRYMDNDGDVIYETPSGIKTAYSRAAMFNISQVLADENKLYVTTSGFDGDELYNKDDYSTISMTNVKILRMEKDGKTLSPYAEGTETALSINDLYDAQNYGQDCSKILVIYNATAPKMIVIYE